MGKKKPSTRAGQYKRATKQRASRKRRQDFGRKAKFILFTSSVALALIALVWVVLSGTATIWKNQLVDASYQQTADAGFSLKNIFLSGHNRLSKHAVLHHSKLRYGQPILQISLPKLKTTLEDLPQVRRASIKRKLPHDLHITIEERYPVALWQKGEALHLVDADGILMGTGEPIKHNHLPLLVGSHAPKNLSNLFTMLEATPGVKQLFDSAVFVGKRRWNLWLTNGIEIKLPEENTEEALAQLEALHQKKPLSEQHISSVDLRVPERMFIRPKVQLLQQASQAL